MALQTMVEVQPWSINHASENWNDPWEFRPERFLEKNEGDVLESLQAFSAGPRNCIGRKYVVPFTLTLPVRWAGGTNVQNSLAYVEMRIIMARLIYNFDVSLKEDSKMWIERQQSYAIWRRIPLDVYLTPVTTQNGDGVRCRSIVDQSTSD